MSDAPVHPHLDDVRAQFDSQLGQYVTTLHAVPGWIVALSDGLDDPYWNVLVPTRLDADGVPSLDRVAPVCAALDRSPALYGERTFVDRVASRLADGDAPDPTYADAWLRRSDPVPPTDDAPDGLSIDAVGDGPTVGEYVDVFEAAYGVDATDAPDRDDEPYVGIPRAYAVRLRESALSPTGSGAWLRRFVASLDGEPVGIGTVVGYGDRAFLYEAGTVPEHRGRGVGRAMAAHRTRLAFDRGAETVWLQTEPESRVERWYVDMGFQRAFEAVGIAGDWVAPS